MSHGHGVDNFSHLSGNGKQLDLGEIRSPTQFSSSQIPIDFVCMYVHTFSLALPILVTVVIKVPAGSESP
jgi:hypothetical protein